MLASFQNISPQNTVPLQRENDGLLEKPDKHQLFQVIKVTLTTGEQGDMFPGVMLREQHSIMSEEFLPRKRGLYE